MNHLFVIRRESFLVIRRDVHESFLVIRRESFLVIRRDVQYLRESACEAPW